MTKKTTRRSVLALIITLPCLLAPTCGLQPQLTISIATPLHNSTVCSSSLAVQVDFSRSIDLATATIRATLVEGIDTAPSPTDVSSLFVLAATEATAIIPLSQEGRLFLSINVDEDGDGQAEDFETVTLERTILTMSPSLLSFSPTTAAPGDAVTILGAGFCPNSVETLITVGSSAAVVTNVNGNAIRFLVPTDFTGGASLLSQGLLLPFSLVVDSAVATPPVTAADITAGFVRGELIATYDAALSPSQIQATATSHGITQQQHYPDIDVYRALLSGFSYAETEAVRVAMESDPNVDTVSANDVEQPTGHVASTVVPGQQWHLFDGASPITTNAPWGWDHLFPSRGQGITIGIIGQGIGTHSLLSQDLSVNRKSGDTVCGNHESFVAAIAASKISVDPTMEIGGVGVAPNAMVESFDVCGGLTSILGFNSFSLRRAVEDAFNFVHVINLSYTTGSNPTPWMSDLTAKATEGVGAPVIVTTTGDDGTSSTIEALGRSDLLPGAYPVIAVGSVAHPGHPEPGTCLATAPLPDVATRDCITSNYGPGLDFVAPGRQISATSPIGTLGSASGTSFAAPQVAGLAALILGEFPDLTPEEVQMRIRDLFSWAPLVNPTFYDSTPGVFLTDEFGDGFIDITYIQRKNAPWRLLDSAYTGSPRDTGTWINYRGGDVYLTGGSNDEASSAASSVAIRVAQDQPGFFAGPLLSCSNNATTQFGCTINYSGGSIDAASAPTLTHLFDGPGFYRVKLSHEDTTTPFFISVGDATIDFSGSQVLSDASGPVFIIVGGNIPLRSFNNTDNGVGTADSFSGFSSLVGVDPSRFTFRFGDLERLSTSFDPVGCTLNVNCSTATIAFGDADGGLNFFEMLLDGVVIASGHATYENLVDIDPNSPTFTILSTTGTATITSGTGAVFDEIMALTNNAGVFDLSFPLVNIVAIFDDPTVSTFSGTSTGVLAQLP